MTNSQSFSSIKDCCSTQQSPRVAGVNLSISTDSPNQPVLLDSPVLPNLSTQKKDTQTMNTQNVNPVVVKIVDSQLGKATIIDHGNNQTIIDNISVKGHEFTSRDLSGYTNGTMLLVGLEITIKGSRKVRSVSEVDLSHQIDTAPIVTPDTAPIVTAQSTSAQSTSVQISILPKIDILAWQSGNYYIAPDLRLGFHTAYNMLVRNPHQSVKILLTGDSGNGKTTLAEKIANLLGLEYVRVNCATMRDVTDWFGFSEITIDPVTSQQITSFEDTQFSRAITRGNALIVLDEFNRVQPDLHNSLFPLLDDAQTTEVHNQIFTVAPNVIFVATVNQGFEYNATFEIDMAMINRFDFVMLVEPMPSDYEIPLLVNRVGIDDFDSIEIVRVANILRESNHQCSTRATLLIARMVLNGLTVRQAYDFALLQRIPPTTTYANQRKTIQDILNVHLGELK